MFKRIFGPKNQPSEIKTPERLQPYSEEEKKQFRERLVESDKRLAEIRINIRKEEEILEVNRQAQEQREQIKQMKQMELEDEKRKGQISEIEEAMKQLRKQGEQTINMNREEATTFLKQQNTAPRQIDLSSSYKIFKYMTLSSDNKDDESLLLSNEDDKFKLICKNFNNTLKVIEKDEDTVHSSYYDNYKEKKFTNVDNNKDLFMVNLSTILNKLRDDYLIKGDKGLIIYILRYPDFSNKINYETFKDYNTITFNNGVKDEVIKYDLSVFEGTKNISPYPILTLLYEIFISFYINDKEDNFTITLSNETPETPETPLVGGKKINKKEILGKVRCIYKKTGDRKEYIKHKGELITVSEYKKMMRDNKKNVVNIKPKAKPKPKPKPKPKATRK